MTDAVLAIREVLLDDGAVSSLTSDAVFGGVLPEHYDPTGSPAVVLTVRGGEAHTEIPLEGISVQVQCWAGINQFILARSVDSVVKGALQGLSRDLGSDGKILTCYAESVGTDSTDPDTGWVQVIRFYKVMAV